MEGKTSIIPRVASLVMGMKPKFRQTGVRFHFSVSSTAVACDNARF